MTKIYNEVIIDMNPDSSTYEEILHEDSFEYDGPMALAVAGGLDRGWTSEGGAWLGKFVKDSEASHMYGGNKYWVFDTDDGYTVLVDDDGKVLSYNVPSVVDTYGDRGDWATAKLQTEAVDAPISTEEDAEGIAKTIDSSDFLQYFDPYSGGIKDKEGLTSYLKGITGKFSSDITQHLIQYTSKYNAFRSRYSFSKNSFSKRCIWYKEFNDGRKAERKTNGGSIWSL